MPRGVAAFRDNRVFEYPGLTFSFSRLTGMKTCTPIPVAMGLEYHVQ